MERASKTVHSIQLLRTVAALLVALFHVQKAFAEKILPADFDGQSYLFAFGQSGVHIFFVISGFIMVYTVGLSDRYSAKDFFRRRFIRIYPIYWVCAALYLVVHALLGRPYELGAGEFVGSLLLLPGNSALIIGPGWTLAFEMFFYLAFGLAMLAGLTRGLILLSAVFVAMIGLGAFLPEWGAAWKLVTDALLLEFIAGAVIGWLLVHDRLPRRGGAAMVAASLILFGAGIAWGYDRLPSVIIWGVPSALLIAGVLSLERLRGAATWVRWGSHLGNSSYVLYLIHILVITLAIELARATGPAWPLGPGLSAVVFAILSLGVALFIHNGIERPLLAWLNSTNRPWNVRRLKPSAGLGA